MSTPDFDASVSSVARITIRVASTWSTMPLRLATMAAPESRATIAPCRCPRTGPRHAAAAQPDAACSSPSGRGWRRRSRGTGSARRQPKPSAWAKRPSDRRFPWASGRCRRRGEPRPGRRVNVPSLLNCDVGLGDVVLGLFHGGEIDHVVGQHAVHDLAVRASR